MSPPPLRFATYNVAWFDRLFDDYNRFDPEAGTTFRSDISATAQWQALGLVFDRIDADAIMVIEAPNTAHQRNTKAALEQFAATFGLRARQAVHGPANDTQQEIALLYDPDRLSARVDPLTIGPPRFDDVFHIDLNIDDVADHVRFSKPPLELAVQITDGPSLRLIGAHLKSKAPHGANSREEAMQLAIANRRKQLAQAIWLRARVAAQLARGEHLLVMGDLNDGPGLDQYEKLFGRSSVEVVIGADPPQLFDPHANRALSLRLEAAPTTSRFYIHHQKRWLEALLDYILVSKAVRDAALGWRIWHPFDDPECYSDSALREALLTASDHFPVSLDLAFPADPLDVSCFAPDAK